MASQELFTFFLLSLLLVPATFAAETCQIMSCGGNEITVSFPFRLEGMQPENCGYPGFDLSCNSNHKTVLKLPHSGDFLLRDVNYLTQEIQLHDSENCMAKRLLNFNLSGSPFLATFYQNYTFLSCPTQYVTSRFYTIDCLSNSTVSVLATSSMRLVESMNEMCQIIATRPVPVPWPFQYDGFTTSLNEDIMLTWYSPDCSECEIQGGLCGFNNNSSREIGCSYNSGKESGGLRIFKVICLSIVVPAILSAIGICGFLIATDRRQRRRGDNIRVLNTTTAVAPQPACGVMGLDESTIESYEKVVLGESKRLPRPDDSTCAICLSEYRSKDTVRCIPECKHCFHADCIDEWLRLKGICPVCRNSPSPAHPSS